MEKGPVQTVISSMEYHKMSFSSLCALSCLEFDIAVMSRMANQLVLAVCTLICRHLKINLLLLLLESFAKEIVTPLLEISLKLCPSQLLTLLTRNDIHFCICILSIAFVGL